MQRKGRKKIMMSHPCKIHRMKIEMEKVTKSDDNADKKEISDVMNDGSLKVDTQSEITDKSDRNDPSKEIVPNITDNRKSGKGTSGRNKGKGVNYKNRVDAYMKQRSINRQVQENNEEATGKKSEISDSNRHMQTRSQRQLHEADENEAKGNETKSASEKEDEEEENYFSCKIYSQTFKNHTMFKKHKVSCTKIKKKHCCSEYGKSFSQPSLLTQHFNFDYRHTDKPKSLFVLHVGNLLN